MIRRLIAKRQLVRSQRSLVIALPFEGEPLVQIIEALVLVFGFSAA